MYSQSKSLKAHSTVCRWDYGRLFDLLHSGRPPHISHSRVPSFTLKLVQQHFRLDMESTSLGPRTYTWSLEAQILISSLVNSSISPRRNSSAPSDSTAGSVQTLNTQRMVLDPAQMPSVNAQSRSWPPSSANNLYTLLHSWPLHLGLSAAVSRTFCTTGDNKLLAPTCFVKAIAISFTPLQSSVVKPPLKSLAEDAVGMTPFTGFSWREFQHIPLLALITPMWMQTISKRLHALWAEL